MQERESTGAGASKRENAHASLAHKPAESVMRI